MVTSAVSRWTQTTLDQSRSLVVSAVKSAEDKVYVVCSKFLTGPTSLRTDYWLHHYRVGELLVLLGELAVVTGNSKARKKN